MEIKNDWNYDGQLYSYITYGLELGNFKFLSFVSQSFQEDIMPLHPCACPLVCSLCFMLFIRLLHWWQHSWTQNLEVVTE